MGKQLVSSMKSTVQYHDNHPGCMWGLLHILDYHHWHNNIRNVFPLKKHCRRRHARYKRKNLLHNHGEDQQIGVSEAEPVLVRQLGQKWSATGKSSPKSSKKGSHTENMSKEVISKGWIISYHGESKRLESSHKFVQSKAYDNMDYSGQKQTTSEAPHMKKDGKIREAALDQKLIEAKKLNRDTSIKSRRHSDVLEVLGVEKDLLLKFLQGLDVGGENLQLALSNKARLTKSGSVPQTSQMRSISPTIFENRQNEIWAFQKGEKLPDGTQAQKVFPSSFGKDISYVEPMALESDLSVHSAMKQKQSFSPSSNPQGLNHKGWNQLVLYRFKVIKQKIRHALMEFKKSGYQTSVEAIHHRASTEYEYSIANNEKEISQSLDGGTIQDYINSGSSDETKASDYDSSIHEVRSMRRASSLNESLDRYTQLFEKSFSKDTKRHSSKSKSLKLSNEDKNNTSVRPSKAYRRNLSLPNLDSFSFFILHEALSGANDMGVTEETDIHVQRKSVSLPLTKDISLDHITETEMEEAVDSGGKDVKPTLLSDKTMEKNDEEMKCEHMKDTDEPALEHGTLPQEQEEISMAIYTSKEAMATLETSCENNKTSHAEGRELNARDSSMDELESDLPNGGTGSVYSWPGSLHNTNATAEGAKIKSDTDTDSNFKYVKDVLEFLGFMGNEDIQMWHTLDQLLKPSLLMDLDRCWGHEIESTGEDSVNTNHHLLLFNVVKEVLLQLHETSTYFPRPFSFNNHLRPMHKGQHLLNEVWTRVNSYLSLRPELDQTLDDVVGRDLAKSSGWMNLQHEEECVALALEEMIVKDLLDEVIFS